jgi:hypothetical protein
VPWYISCENSKLWKVSTSKSSIESIEEEDLSSLQKGLLRTCAVLSVDVVEQVELARNLTHGEHVARVQQPAEAHHKEAGERVFEREGVEYLCQHRRLAAAVRPKEKGRPCNT